MIIKAFLFRCFPYVPWRPSDFFEARTATKTRNGSCPVLEVSPGGEEKDANGTAYSLVEFPKVVLSGPELVDILWIVAEKPSARSIIKHGGSVAVGIGSDEDPAAADSALWALPRNALCSFPAVIGLDERPASRVLSL